jgi:hypothetical protein
MQQEAATKNARPCGLAISMPTNGHVPGKRLRAKPFRRRCPDAALLLVRLLLVTTLVASLAEQLAMLLLRHALATLLDYGTHTHLLNSGFTDS